MTKPNSLLLVFLLLTFNPPPCWAEVVRLTDLTFEHQTQASTGMTTGSWLVMFGGVPSAACDGCLALGPALDELSQDEALHERGVVVGTVDCSHVGGGDGGGVDGDGDGTCRRFGVTELPTLIYLHRGAMYRVPPHDVVGAGIDGDGAASPPPADGASADALRAFVLGGYRRADAGAVPPPPSPLDAFLGQLAGVYGAARENTLLGVAILLMSTMLVLTAGVLVVALASSARTRRRSGGTGAGGVGGKSKKRN